MAIKRKNKAKPKNKKIKSRLVKSSRKKIKTKKIKTFTKDEYRIPNYSKEKLFHEANLFLLWYLPKFIKGKKRNIERKKISKIFKNLLNKLKVRASNTVLLPAPLVPTINVVE